MSVVETEKHKFTNKSMHVKADPISLADSEQIDAFGRMRISAPFGIFDNKQIHTRNTGDWEERIWGAIITHGGVTGTFTVGDTFSGNTSGEKGTITAVAAGSITYSTTNGNDFTDGETITILTGGVPGSTAVVATHNSGSDIVYNYDRSSTYLKAGTATGCRVIRQSTRYLPYVPGKSHSIEATGIIGAGKANVKQYIMYGDDLNGIGYCLNGTALSILLRTSTSSSAVDTLIPQTDWNVDTLTSAGLNPSGLTLDITKSQIEGFDFQWLGVGRVRFSFNIGGISILVHESKHANLDAVVYMKTPSLPVRYEVINSGVAASTTTLEQICCSVTSEGGYALPGEEFSAGNGITRVAVTTRRPILAIRLKSAFPTGKPNRRIVRFLDWSVSAKTNDGYFELMHINDPSGITATWADVSAGTSGVEYSTDISALTGMMEHRVQIANVAAGLGSSSNATVANSEFVSNHSFICQNFESTNSQMFVIYCTAEAGTCNALGHISFIESE